MNITIVGKHIAIHLRMNISRTSSHTMYNLRMYVRMSICTGAMPLQHTILVRSIPAWSRTAVLRSQNGDLCMLYFRLGRQCWGCSGPCQEQGWCTAVLQGPQSPVTWGTWSAWACGAQGCLPLPTSRCWRPPSGMHNQCFPLPASGAALQACSTSHALGSTSSRACI